MDAVALPDVPMASRDDGGFLTDHKPDPPVAVWPANCSFMPDPSGHPRILVAYTIGLLAVNIFFHVMLMLALLCAGRSRPSHVILWWLSVTDLCVALVYLPCVLTLLVTSGGLHCRALCSALSALERGLIAGCVWGTALVSFDRYLYIVHHTRYHRLMTGRSATLASLGVWLVAALFGAVSSIVSAHSTDGHGHCLCHLTLDFYGIYHLLYSAAFITLCFVLPTTLILVFYGFIARVAYQRAAHSHKNPFRLPSSVLRPNDGCQGLLGLRAARVLAPLLALYLACVTPYFILNIAVSTGSWAAAFPQAPYLLTILLLHTNTAVNPMLYGLPNRRLRGSLLTLFRGRLPCLLGSPQRRRSSQLSLMEDSCSDSQCWPPRREASSYSSTSRDSFLPPDEGDLDDEAEDRALTANPASHYCHCREYSEDSAMQDNQRSTLDCISASLLEPDSSPKSVRRNSTSRLKARLAHPRVRAVAQELARQAVPKVPAQHGKKTNSRDISLTRSAPKCNGFTGMDHGQPTSWCYSIYCTYIWQLVFRYICKGFPKEIYLLMKLLSHCCFI